jgi:hypothetical protein
VPETSIRSSISRYVSMCSFGRGSTISEDTGENFDWERLSRQVPMIGSAAIPRPASPRISIASIMIVDVRIRVSPLCFEISSEYSSILLKICDASGTGGDIRPGTDLPRWPAWPHQHQIEKGGRLSALSRASRFAGRGVHLAYFQGDRPAVAAAYFPHAPVQCLMVVGRQHGRTARRATYSPAFVPGQKRGSDLLSGKPVFWGLRRVRIWQPATVAHSGRSGAANTVVV